MRAVDTTTTPVLNTVLLQAVLDDIKADLKAWDQRHYALKMHDQHGAPCGTAYCFAGHAVRRAYPQATFAFRQSYTGLEDSALSVELGDGKLHSIDNLATEILGLTTSEASVLFDGGNSLASLEHMIGVLTAPAYRRTIRYRDHAESVTVQ